MTDFVKFYDKFFLEELKEQYGNEKRQATYLFVGLDGLYF